MKRYGSFFEKAVDFNNLVLAAKKAAKGKELTIQAQDFLFRLEPNIIEIQKELLSEEYIPRPYRTFMVHDPKQRLISSAHFRDRVVHHSICAVLEPVFESISIYDSYACRKNKGSHKAIKKARKYLKNNEYYLKNDIDKFFASVDHSVLKYFLRRKVKDSKMNMLIDTLIDHPVPGCVYGKGLPIGNLTSQHFANFYLGELDHFIKERLRIKGYIRYMDDFILFGNSKKMLNNAHKEIKEYLLSVLKLKIKDSQTMLAPANTGLSFLGFRIFRNLIRIQQKGFRRFKRKVLRRINEYDNGYIDELKFEQSLSSLVSHIKTANTYRIRQKFFENQVLGQE
ncbi:MAG: group II intron reverse transcriptase domain-containing protein [Candidatus Brocadiales bacterium]|nr:group II intron reverse transcriptase domain-containing protein [Candidatus Brocadiales bacterium]